MDIYEYIRADHEEVNHLFKLFEKSNNAVRRQQIIEMLVKELLIHLESEERTFYKTLENFSSTKDDALHGKKEHKQIEEKIKNILPVKEGQEWNKKVQELKKCIEHHVHEEEHQLFNKAKEIFSANEANVIKEKMHYLKQMLKLSI
ncbi:hemerythrin domain-containing protein [Legionella saoudiensis]|uniref:hemerythrin domain-containing protein n=1 Tax=Legionella saoudiensis TaxID=1750561 RepID=UPI000730D588|nr:hemerythrin domain-containing protein [Legionella saoudiensis]